MIRAAPDVDSACAVVDQATAALSQEDSPGAGPGSEGPGKKAVGRCRAIR